MITFHDDIEQGSELWFELRCGSLGASRAKDALAGGTGATRKKLMYQLAAEKATGQKESMFQTAAMAEGIRREPESRAFFELYKGIELEEVGLIVNDKFPGCHCSPDGINRGMKCGFEVKNPSAAVHVEYLLKGKIPATYMKQLLFSLMITEYDSWWFSSYYPGLKPLVVELKRDDAKLEDMAIMVREFVSGVEDVEKQIS
jgi:hypothetical protein